MPFPEFSGILAQTSSLYLEDLLLEYQEAECRLEVVRITEANESAGLMCAVLWTAHEDAMARLEGVETTPDVVSSPVSLEPSTKSTFVFRTKSRYQILNLDITWTEKPQVLAIAAILAAHAQPGEILDESYIIEILLANETLLNTRQGAVKVWNYYKGYHADGLSEHGNIKKL